MNRDAVAEKRLDAEPADVGRFRMSYDEWLDWDYEGGLTEWIDGEVHIYMPATRTHQRLVEFLDRVLGLFVELMGLGIVKLAPYSMRAIPDGNGREPDVMFVATEHLDRLREKELVGPADLVVEIISDDSVERDRDKKFTEYEQGGVREYWIFDPRPKRLRADFYVLNEMGRFQPVPVGTDGIYHATVLQNFWLKVEWLWDEKVIPLRVLAQIVGKETVLANLGEEE